MTDISKTIPQTTNIINSEGLSECFCIYKTKLYVSLAPCHIKTPINGVKSQHLDPLLMNYFPKAEGIVIGYSDIAITDDQHNEFIDNNNTIIQVGKISPGSPFIFFWITVNLLVWKPQLGDILQGYIYMQTASHIGILVHDTFNASIKKYNIPSNWEFIPNQIDEIENGDTVKNLGYWHDEHGIKVEGKIKFTIKNIHSTSRVVSIDGTLIKPGTELENQPVFRQRRSSNAMPSNKHTKFSDDFDVVQEETEMPRYADDSE